MVDEVFGILNLIVSDTKIIGQNKASKIA